MFTPAKDVSSTFCFERICKSYLFSLVFSLNKGRVFFVNVTAYISAQMVKVSLKANLFLYFYSVLVSMSKSISTFLFFIFSCNLKPYLNNNTLWNKDARQFNWG